MSIDNSINAGPDLLSLNARDLRGKGARRTGQEETNGAVRRGPLENMQVREVLIQSFTQPSPIATTSDQSGSIPMSTPENPVPDQALANFVQNLFSALGQNAGTSSGIPPSPEGPGLTKEALASSLDEAKTSDTNRYDRNLALLNNFEIADANGDGAISHVEAYAFNQSNSIPTIENGAMVRPGQSSTSQGYQPEFGAQMAANLQDLIQQLGNTSSTSTGNLETAAEATRANAANPSLNSLEISYGNLLSAFGGDSSTGSLAHFLETLKSNLGSIGATGNVVNTTA